MVQDIHYLSAQENIFYKGGISYRLKLFSIHFKQNINFDS